MTDNEAWSPIEPLICESGDVGGDYQVGEAWEVRYRNPTIPGAMINVRVYAEAARDDHGEPTGEYLLSSQTEYLVYEDDNDPGGTEVWSDYEYDDETALYGIDYRNSEAVTAMARLIAEDYASKPGVFTWDGKPTW